jgi:hypothetical protein
MFSLLRRRKLSLFACALSCVERSSLFSESQCKLGNCWRGKPGELLSTRFAVSAAQIGKAVLAQRIEQMELHIHTNIGFHYT